MNARAAAALLSLALASLPAQSGVNKWTPVASLPESDGGPAFLWTPPTSPSLLWTQSGTGWFWQSRDGGNHFALTKGQPGPHMGLFLHPDDPQRAWAFGPVTGEAPSAVFETRDAGRSWQRRLAGAPSDMVWTPILGGALIGSQPPYRLVISYQGRSAWKTLGDCTGGSLRVAPSDGRVFCLGGGALYRVDLTGHVDFVGVSPDGNPNWMIGDLIVAPRDSSVLYAVLWINEPKLARSENRGATWQLLPDPIPQPPDAYATPSLLAVGPDSRRLRVLAFRPTAAPGTFAPAVVESLDGGATWSAPRPAPSGAVFADPVHPHVLFAWNDSVLERSSDDGETWEATGRIPLAGSLESPAVHLLEDGRPEILGLVSLSDASVRLARSVDAGGTWHESILPPSIRPLYGKLVLDPVDPSRMYLVTSRGVAKSSDRGQSWSIVTPDALAGANDLVISPRDGADLYEPVGYQSVVGVSHDRGITWTISGNGLGPVEDPDHGGGSGGLALVLDPDTPQRAWLAFDAALPGGWDVYHTADFGLTWHPSRSGIPHLATFPRGLLRTRTGRLLVGTESGLLASWDGLDWHSIGIAPIELVLADPETATLYAVVGPEGSARLSASHDDGETWEPITCGLPGGIPEKLLLDPSASGRLLATLRGLGLWRARFDRPCP